MRGIWRGTIERHFHVHWPQKLDLWCTALELCRIDHRCGSGVRVCHLRRVGRACRPGRRSASEGCGCKGARRGGRCLPVSVRIRHGDKAAQVGGWCHQMARRPSTAGNGCAARHGQQLRFSGRATIWADGLEDGVPIIREHPAAVCVVFAVKGNLDTHSLLIPVAHNSPLTRLGST